MRIAPPLPTPSRKRTTIAITTPRGVRGIEMRDARTEEPEEDDVDRAVQQEDSSCRSRRGEGVVDGEPALEVLDLVHLVEPVRCEGQLHDDDERVEDHRIDGDLDR